MLGKLGKILALSREREKEGHLSVSRQLSEMAILYLLRDVGPRYYHTAGFWRRSVNWNDKMSHLNAREYRRFIDRVNPVEYRKLSQNKIAEKAIITLFDLPTPRFVGRLAAACGVDAQGRPLRNAGELASLIRKCMVERLVFKKLEGYGGKGVRIARFRIAGENLCAAALTARNNEYVPLEDYCRSVLALGEDSDWLVEEYLEQHPVMAGLNPLSVNTVRIWIYSRPRSESTVVTAYVRIGRGDMYVDNASSGGIVAPLELATGTLRAAQDAYAERRLYPCHPDHGNAIEGVVVPDWSGVQSLAKRVLGVFPNLRFAGLDIAIGRNGPVVLELNVSPDREGAAFTDCPNARLLS
ncbi:MAG TPA: sugar-transfer associated ATP-grasp domain-containing protein [Candidatus Binatia bacterium]|nr:sugar-transfer associated ATP-grasp domain-containing protein [Candidatus Binatia bacterium]